MKDKLSRYEPEDIGGKIYTVRGQRVIMDSDLAEIYGIPTKRLNEQVKRNLKRLPVDFMFQLTKEEAQPLNRLRSHFATSSLHGGRRYLLMYLPSTVRNYWILKCLRDK